MARPDEVEHGHLHGKVCRLLVDRINAKHLVGWGATGAEYKPEPYRRGDVVKCVMVSRLGDCGVTHDLKAENGYDIRVEPHELEVIDPSPASSKAEAR